MNASLIPLPRRSWRAVERSRAANPLGYIDDTHDKQRALVMDDSKRIAVQGGRRGGKSQALGRRPGS